MKKAETKGILERVGFSGEESGVYMTLLQHGPLSPSEVVRKAGLHRPAAYRVLTKLQGAGLVSVMPKGKFKVYIAESPDKVERIFQEMEDDFNSEIHELFDLYEKRDKKPIVTFAEGKDAITDTFSDVVHELKKGDTYYRYGSSITLHRARHHIPKDYRAVRDRKGLERLIITDESSKKFIKMRLGKTVKAVPNDFDLFSHNVSQIIFGDKVAFIDYNTKSVVTIENPMIAEFQKKIFRLLFKKL